MERKIWVMLENNPEVMNRLATKLGVSPDLQFYDIYSFDEPELLSHIPRPVFALLAIIPLTPTWDRDRKAEDAGKDDYTGFGPKEPVIWFKQTIGHACGSVGLLHSVINGPAVDFIRPDSEIAAIRSRAIPLPMAERADMLYNNVPFEIAHKSVENVGDSPALPSAEHTGQHFVSFVKADGRLWELEGSRKGPLERGSLAENEDVLSPRALDMGLKRIMRLEREAGGEDLRFSCIALARRS
ncbi:ubiquitin carboxyl-terminal hydrolase [Aspergillus heteromorphus CBS 117.55]|uniref:Ubiquitin carboxyl-terminal hydrolase n=1 Tax=Aspergillus heteromorphus CBS 117.55 TaxID=1448321 RepID=A0A317VBY2_9EURO|nr:ubiquitin carboxyl-terminal hydrolase [Aspergillus heteromorphus CBS 117.55]PWY70508.1 ubiquitin carboxyl-terminal hydrolase [Aspergillus heteromorphus CBS 117.55]